MKRYREDGYPTNDNQPQHLPNHPISYPQPANQTFQHPPNQQYVNDMYHASQRMPPYAQQQFNPFMTMNQAPVNSMFPPMIQPYQSIHPSNNLPGYPPTQHSNQQQPFNPSNQPIKAQIIPHLPPMRAVDRNNQPMHQSNAPMLSTGSSAFSQSMQSQSVPPSMPAPISAPLGNSSEVSALFSSTKTLGDALFWELRTDHKQFLYVTHPGTMTVHTIPLCTLSLIQQPGSNQSANQSIPPLILRAASSRAPWSSSGDRASTSIVTRFEIDQPSKDAWKSAMKSNRMTGQSVQGFVTIVYSMIHINPMPDQPLTQSARQHHTTIQVGWRTGKEEKRRSRSVKRLKSNEQATPAVNPQPTNLGTNLSVDSSSSQSTHSRAPTVQSSNVFESTHVAPNAVDAVEQGSQSASSPANQSNTQSTNSSNSQRSTPPIKSEPSQSAMSAQQSTNQSVNLTQTPSPLMQGLQRHQSFGSAGQSANQPSNQPTNQSLGSPMFQSNQPVGQPATQFGLPVSQSTSAGAFWSVAPPMDPSTNQPVNQSTNQWQPPYEYFRHQMSPQQQPQSTNQSAGQSVNQMNPAPVLVPMAMRNWSGTGPMSQPINQSINPSINSSINHSPQQQIMSPMFSYWNGHSPQHLPVQLLTPRSVSTPAPAPSNTKPLS